MHLILLPQSMMKGDTEVLLLVAVVLIKTWHVEIVRATPFLKLIKLCRILELLQRMVILQLSCWQS